MMATPDTKPTFKVSEKPPLKLPDDAKPQAPIPPAPIAKGDWQPMATAPQEPDARFVVRACVDGEPVNGTETVVRYRVSRKMVRGRWSHGLAIIDDKLETKLGFRPTEWKPYVPPKEVNA